MQPHAVREESQPVPEGVQDADETVLDQVKVQQIKKERKTSSSNLVEPDSTSSQDQFPSQLVDASSGGDNLLRNISLEETCQPTQPAGATSTINQPNPLIYHNLQPPATAQPKPGLSISDQLNQEDISDFDLSFFINQITQPEIEQPLLTSPRPSFLTRANQVPSSSSLGIHTCTTSSPTPLTCTP